MTTEQSGLTRAQLRTPRAAAVAGILFSVLLLAVFWLMRISVPADPHEPGAWLRGGVTYVALALNLVPFAGAAFLWFVGALRAELVAAAAVVGAIIIAFHSAPEALIDSATFHFGRGLAYGMVNIYVVKTASIFMITTSTIALYTQLTPRWLAIGGYVVAVVLLIGSYYLDWSILVFPLWVLLVSICILLDKEKEPLA